MTRKTAPFGGAVDAAGGAGEARTVAATARATSITAIRFKNRASPARRWEQSDLALDPQNVMARAGAVSKIPRTHALVPCPRLSRRHPRPSSTIGRRGGGRAEALRARPGLDRIRRRPRELLARRADALLPQEHSRLRSLDGAGLPPGGPEVGAGGGRPLQRPVERRGRDHHPGRAAPVLHLQPAGGGRRSSPGHRDLDDGADPFGVGAAPARRRAVQSGRRAVPDDDRRRHSVLRLGAARREGQVRPLAGPVAG